MDNGCCMDLTFSFSQLIRIALVNMAVKAKIMIFFIFFKF